MNIGLISFHCCPYSHIGGDGVGGMNVYIKELSAALMEFPGVEIDIFTRRQSPHRARIIQISPGLRVIHLEGGPQRPLDRRRLYDFIPEFIEDLEDFILGGSQSCDLFYSHYWLSGLIGEWIKGRIGVPWVHTYHTLGFLKKKVLTESEHRYRLPAEAHIAGTADRIICSSEEERDNLLMTYGVPCRKLSVISPGVNSNLFRPAARESAPFRESGSGTLLYVGRIEPVKGLMDVVTALGILRDRDPDLFGRLELAVIGGGRSPAEIDGNREVQMIRAVLKSLHLENKVRFLGSMPQERLKDYYSAAAALVVPSLYESFGLVVVEALACGTPVLASRIGKMKTLVREGLTGFTFAPRQPGSLAACLQRFFSRRHDLWPAESIRADVVERFSWRRTADATRAVFEELGLRRSGLTTTLPRGESPQPA